MQNLAMHSGVSSGTLSSPLDKTLPMSTPNQLECWYVACQPFPKNNTFGSMLLEIGRTCALPIENLPSLLRLQVQGTDTALTDTIALDVQLATKVDRGFRVQDIE